MYNPTHYNAPTGGEEEAQQRNIPNTSYTSFCSHCTVLHWMAGIDEAHFNVAWRILAACVYSGGWRLHRLACNVCTQKLPPPKCLSTVAAPFSPIRAVLREWSCDQGGDICPNHYRDIWHLRPLSADMLSYLGADVEISCPGVLANSTSRNGPMDHSCSRWNPCTTGPREANCWVPHVPQPWAFATGFSHYARHYVRGSNWSTVSSLWEPVWSVESDLDLGSRNYLGIILTCSITGWSPLFRDKDRLLTQHSMLK